jgi:hypothetical protein
MARTAQCSIPRREPDSAGFDLVGAVGVDFMLAYFLWCVSDAEYNNISPSALSPERLGMGVEDVIKLNVGVFSRSLSGLGNRSEEEPAP